MVNVTIYLKKNLVTKLKPFGLLQMLIFCLFHVHIFYLFVFCLLFYNYVKTGECIFCTMFIFCVSLVFDSQYLILFHQHCRNLRIDYTLYIALVLSAYYTSVVGIITRGSTTHIRQMSNSIKLLSANCQGLGDNTKCVDVLNYLDQLKCDITCLQDTHWIEKDIKKIKNLWPGEVLLSGFKRNSRGVAILLKKTFEFTIMDTYSDNSGNLLVVDLKTSEMSIKIINIYAPNVDSPSFFKRIFEIIDNSSLDYFLLCGDFNLVLDPTVDCYNYKNINNPQSQNLLLSSMSNGNWRHFSLT